MKEKSRDFHHRNANPRKWQKPSARFKTLQNNSMQGWLKDRKWKWKYKVAGEMNEEGPTDFFLFGNAKLWESARNVNSKWWKMNRCGERKKICDIGWRHRGSEAEREILACSPWPIILSTLKAGIQELRASLKCKPVKKKKKKTNETEFKTKRENKK